MVQDQTKKEALFNEVKGSLFEYLVAKRISLLAGEELNFIQSLDKNYLTVLSQQDRMVRQFYPEMLKFLEEVSNITVKTLLPQLQISPVSSRLTGKFSNSSTAKDLYEADLIVTDKNHNQVPISLKLNKKNAYVNTKSGGIKSFFSQYFSFLPSSFQEEFNHLVDQEFIRMACELHALNDFDYPGNFSAWIKAGKSELPGELNPEERLILKAYYSRIAKDMHRILLHAFKLNPEEFSRSLSPLLGFGSSEIIQVVCFHDFKSQGAPQVEVHSFKEVKDLLSLSRVEKFQDISSVEISLGHWSLQVRVKPMNKFTTTAIKINCSVKVTRP
jgi:hypothetical protein